MHSPFVFSLVESVLRNKTKPILAQNIESLRDELKRNHQSIQFEDLGAGSQASKNSTVSLIAKHSLSTKNQCQVLYRLAKHVGAKHILELGTSLGISTAYFACATETNVWTIEGAEPLADLARNNWKSLGLQNIKSEVGHFDEQLGQVLDKMPSLDMVYIDGNHQKEPTLSYFEQVLQKAHNDTVVIFDDIHWSAEMEEAWTHLKFHPQVRVTIDLFWMGIVFIRKELSKEDFTIRY